MNPRKHRPRRSAREAVLDAAALLFTENPGASMAALAEAAGVGRATLYRYFPTRE
ncbi:MAG: TetR family transcriptional regulator, partial [Acidobacteriota bacterium]